MKPDKPSEEIQEKIEGKEKPSKVEDVNTPIKNKLRSFDSKELTGSPELKKEVKCYK